jgi:UDP-N-acetylglucosamine 1-carboxyvinyltransferase
MGVLTIKGGRRLEGELRVHGAKNSVLPVLAATVLGSRESLLFDCPRLRDVETMLAILRSLGCGVVREEDRIIVRSESMTGDTIPDNLMRELRSSVVFMGSILARTGHVRLSFPGGCMLGARPIDLHLAAMRKLGAEVKENGADIECRVDRLVGTDIPLSLPSVGATENIMLAATAAVGTTRIINAAREPEIEDLQTYLRASGASVYGAGSSVITIEGGTDIKPAVHRIIPDRIEAATYLAAAASAGGSLRLTNVCPEHIPTIT